MIYGEREIDCSRRGGFSIVTPNAAASVSTATSTSSATSIITVYYGHSNGVVYTRTALVIPDSIALSDESADEGSHEQMASHGVGGADLWYPPDGHAGWNNLEGIVSTVQDRDEVWISFSNSRKDVSNVPQECRSPRK